MKQGEVDYMRAIGDEAAQGAYNKPFSHFTCSKNLVDIGLIMALLPQPPARVLDLGCGTGWTSIFFARRGYSVVGQDIAPDMIDYAKRNRERYQAENLEFIVSDYESLRFVNEFDAAVFYDALHHAEDERAALASTYRALKPGGMLITHEPGIGHSKSPDSIRAMELYGVTEKDMPPSKIRALCKELGFSDFKCLPDPTLAVMSVYGINLGSLDHTPLSWWRRFRKIRRLIIKPQLKHGGICLMTK